MKYVLVLLSVAILLTACEKKSIPVVKAEVGKPAPAFTLSDTKGGKVSLSDFRGKVTVLEFWATWCGPCIESVPEMNGLNTALKGKDVVILGISVDEGTNALQKVTEFAAVHPVNYQILLSDKATADQYGVTNIPVLFILDRQHTIVTKYPGYRPGMAEDLVKDIEALL